MTFGGQRGILSLAHSQNEQTEASETIVCLDRFDGSRNLVQQWGEAYGPAPHLLASVRVGDTSWALLYTERAAVVPGGSGARGNVLQPEGAGGGSGA